MADKKRIFSEEHKNNLSESRKGIVFTDEHKENISKAVLAKPLTITPGHNKIPHEFIEGIEHKHCGKCEKFVSIDKFYKRGKTYDKLDHKCKQCDSIKRKEKYDSDPQHRQKQIDYVINHQRQLKTKYVQYKGDACLDCGLKHIENNNEAVFDFHHRDPAQKKFGIAEKVGWSLEKMKPELDKCDLVCSMCHALRHQKEWRTIGRNKKPPAE